jgi:hypothetical protein
LQGAVCETLRQAGGFSGIPRRAFQRFGGPWRGETSRTRVRLRERLLLHPSSHDRRGGEAKRQKRQKEQKVNFAFFAFSASPVFRQSPVDSV